MAAFRIGLGYDSHRLAPVGEGGGEGAGGQVARPMIIGGVAFASARGPVAHSDGDALMHAITDAVLGAAGLPDIGQLFPDRDPRWAGAASEVFLLEAVEQARRGGWVVGNVDATVIVDEPKLGPRKDEVRANLARLLAVDVSSVNVKGKTHELGGEPSKNIEAMAAVLLVRG